MDTSKLTEVDLLAATDRLDELVAYYQKVVEIAIPATLRDAVQTDWEMTAEGLLDAVVREITLGYKSEDRKRDRKKIVKMSDVLRVINDLEEQLVKDQVRDPLDAAWRQIGQFIEYVKILYEHGREIWAGAKLLFRGIIDAITGSGLDELNAALKVIHGAFIFGVAALPLLLQEDSLIRISIGVLKTRDVQVKNLRKRALFQTNARRYWRRKVART